MDKIKIERIKNQKNLGITLSENGGNSFHEGVFTKYFVMTNKLYYDGANFFYYRDKHLLRISDIQIKKDCKKLFDDIEETLWKYSYENRYYPTLKIDSKLIQKKDLNKFPFKANFANGVYDFKTQTFEKHSEENNFTYIHDYPIYNELVETPLFDELIKVVSNGQEELAEYILEFMAYIVSGNKTEQKFFIFKGNGQNGKSTLINLIGKLINQDFVTNISLSKLDDKFALSCTEGKRLIVASENESSRNKPISTENLKILSSGNELITIEKKYQDSYSTTLQVELIFAINNTIKFSETSFGLERRLVVIPFDGIITNPDSEFEKNLEDEIPLIMTKLIHKYNNIVKRGYRLPSCTIVEEATKSLLQESNHIKIDTSLLEYFEEYLDIQEEGLEKKKDIFNHYLSILGETSETKFWIEFRKWLKLKKIEFKEKRNIERYICGICLKRDNNKNNLDIFCLEDI